METTALNDVQAILNEDRQRILFCWAGPAKDTRNILPVGACSFLAIGWFDRISTERPCALRLPCRSEGDGRYLRFSHEFVRIVAGPRKGELVLPAESDGSNPTKRTGLQKELEITHKRGKSYMLRKGVQNDEAFLEQISRAREAQALDNHEAVLPPFYVKTRERLPRVRYARKDVILELRERSAAFNKALGKGESIEQALQDGRDELSVWAGNRLSLWPFDLFYGGMFIAAHGPQLNTWYSVPLPRNNPTLNWRFCTVELPC